MLDSNLPAAGLYLIATDPAAGYRKFTEAAVKKQIPFLQLRIKNSPVEQIKKTARLLRDITRGTATRLIINDHVDIAIEVDADGVHLGQNDCSIKEAKQKWQRHDKLYGLSTHSYAQALAALPQQPDYIGVGPIYPTPTKEIPDPTVGIKNLSKIINVIEIQKRLPCIAIGGIDKTNIIDVKKSGATRFAVVRAVCRSNNPEEAISELLSILAVNASST